MDYNEKARKAWDDAYRCVTPRDGVRMCRPEDHILAFGRACAADALVKFGGQLKQMAVVLEEPDHNRIAAKVETLDLVAGLAEREAAALRQEGVGR